MTPPTAVYGISEEDLYLIAEQALYHQLTAQVGRQQATDVHISVSRKVFISMFLGGMLSRTHIGMWEYSGALLWVK
ncbi:hypothetical protein KDA23_04310 [Candidatus Saccharibacteria bacterium]|nr:hypothetical protein [Candidatus Saccharibacteria bacterium]